MSVVGVPLARTYFESSSARRVQRKEDEEQLGGAASTAHFCGSTHTGFAASGSLAWMRRHVTLVERPKKDR